MGYDDQTEMGGVREAFLTTQWSLIEDVRGGEDRDRALTGFLLEQYWKPVYCYLRRRGHDNEEAKDLTQGFFHEVVLNRDLVGRADRARGRFRAFLLHALHQYAAKQRRKAGAAKRIPKHKLIPLEVSEPPAVPERVANASAEETYHYAWLSALLERAIAEVSTQCAEEGLKAHWKLFQERVVGPILDSRTAPPLADLCRTYGIEDAKTASNMIITVKRRFRTALLGHVRRTVLAEDQAADELDELLRFFPRRAQHSE
jgi:RNA polymerase sigma-70 factor (ECF subfamily)